MPNIKPVSDLRNYASVLMEVHENEPVYLTKMDAVRMQLLILQNRKTMKKQKLH